MFATVRRVVLPVVPVLAHTLAVVSLLAIGCGEEPADGELGGACIDLTRCSGGLLCLVDTCVNPGSQGNGQVCENDAFCFSGYCDPLQLVCQANAPRPQAEVLVRVCDNADRCPEIDSTFAQLDACPGALEASLDATQELAALAALVAADRRTQDCLLECMGLGMCPRFREAAVTSVEGMIDADFTATYDACVPAC